MLGKLAYDDLTHFLPVAFHCQQIEGRFFMKRLISNTV
jgi:hypothetical protein